MSRRGKALLLICLAAVVIVAAYGGYRTTRGASTTEAIAAVAAWGNEHPSFDRIYFRYNGSDANFGRLTYVDSSDMSKIGFAGALACESVYVAGGRGICLVADRGMVTKYSAKIFDAVSYATLFEIPLYGVPSRSRVSRDGRLAASTVFVAGHGYASVDFSTQTLLIDTTTGKVLADLESFRVMRDGQSIQGNDFNFWGVTFTPDSKGFYATLSTGREHLLVRGNIEARTAEVVHQNVECPSLSPDARHLAFKQRLTSNGAVVWQLHVLDLQTMQATALAERGSIDDQLEWLDNSHVLYAVASGGRSPSTTLWMVGIDGSREPVPFLPNAYSPAVVR